MKVFRILGLGVVLPAVCIFSLSCRSTAKKYIEKGAEAEAGKNFEEASILYLKAIQKEPASEEAYTRLGLSELKRGKVGEAVAALQHAADLSPNDPEPKIKLADLLLAAHVAAPQHTEDLAARLSKIADQLLAGNPESFEGLKLKGSLALSDGNAVEAISFFRRADHVKPFQPEIMQLLSSALIRNGQVAEGLDLANQVIEKHKDYRAVYDFLYEYYVVHNRLPDAEKIAQLKVSNNPGVADYVIQLAEHFARLQRGADVQAELQKLLDDPRVYPTGRLQVGEFYSGQRKPEEALRVYREGLQVDTPRKIEYQRRIANILYQQGKRDEAAKLVEQILHEQPRDEGARLVRTRMLVDTGKLESIDTAITELKALAAEHHEDTGVSFELGKAYAAKGDLKNSREQFRNAVPNPGTYLPANQALAQIDQNQQNWRSMLQHADFALLMDPANATSRLLRATALGGTGDYEKAQSEVRGILKDFPRYTEARLELGQLALAQGNFQEAESIFNAVLNTGAADVSALSGLVDVYLASKKFNAALHMLTAKLSENPDSAAVRSLLADVALRSENFDLAIAQLEQLIAKYPAAGELYFRLGSAFYEKGDDKDAIVNFQKALTRDPANVQAALMLATATGRPEDMDKAIAVCRQALKVDPDLASAQNNLAFLTAEKGGNLDESLAMARRAVEIMPWQSSFVDTLGYVMAKKGMADESVNVLEKLVHDHPESAAFHYHLALALVTKGDRPKALSELHLAMESRPSRSEKGQIKELLVQVN
jgi:tetratricopeptide (TPR) repeat protein